MEALFKKYFWVVNLIVLAAVAWLIAQTITDYLAVRYLTVPNEVAEVATVASDDPLLEKAQVEGLAQTLTERSPFNVDEKKVEKPEPKDPDCVPACDEKSCGDDGCGGKCGECTDEQTCEDGACKDPEEEASLSELNIELKGTLANPADPTQRFANIMADGSAELVVIGSEVLEKAVVVDIQPKMLYLREGNKLTHVSLWGEAPKKGGMSGKPMSKVKPRTTAQLKRPDPNKKPAKPPGRPGSFDYSKGVKKDGDFAYTIDKQMLDEQLTDLTQLGMQARVIPNYRKGKYEGFKLVGVRPGSLYRAIGVRSGDIVRSINGRAINSPNKAMELFNQLKNSSGIKMEVERRGKIENFEYTIR
ncbi:MAG: type II secretion system protein C [Myxococcota bacterium]|jgi:type II secretion system protein C